MDGAGDRVDDAWRTAPRPDELVDVLAAGAAGTRGVADGIVAAAAVRRQLSGGPDRKTLGGHAPHQLLPSGRTPRGHGGARFRRPLESGRASCRVRTCEFVWLSVVAVELTTKTQT